MLWKWAVCNWRMKKIGWQELVSNQTLERRRNGYATNQIKLVNASFNTCHVVFALMLHKSGEFPFHVGSSSFWPLRYPKLSKMNQNGSLKITTFIWSPICLSNSCFYPELLFFCKSIYNRHNINKTCVVFICRQLCFFAHWLF